MLNKIVDINSHLGSSKTDRARKLTGITASDDVIDGCLSRRTDTGPTRTCSSERSTAGYSPDFNAESNTEPIESISFQFSSGSSLLTVNIEGYDFHCLLDSGAAVTAISASVWQNYLRRAYGNLINSVSEEVTSVDGRRLVTLGKVFGEICYRLWSFPF